MQSHKGAGEPWLRGRLGHGGEDGEVLGLGMEGEGQGKGAAMREGARTDPLPSQRGR